MKHFSEEDVLALKKSEQGGGFCGVFASLIVFVLVAAVMAVTFSMDGEPGTAVQVQATAIYGPTELVLANTPTLRPTVTAPALLLVPATVEAVAATAVPTTIAAPTYTPAATYTPPPTYTAVPSQTPAATYTLPATWTAVPTFTPVATYTPPPTPLPMADIQDVASQYMITSATLTRLTWLVAALITFGFVALLVGARPSDKDLRRIQKLLEMHLMAALRPPAPVQALPAPVRTTPLKEYLAKRAAPVQNTGYTGVTGANTGAAPAEIITVSVQPADEPSVDVATMEAICAVWNEIAERGERPSQNNVCLAYFGSKNSDRMAIIKRAIRWGREQGIVGGVVNTAVNGEDEYEL